MATKLEVVSAFLPAWVVSTLTGCMSESTSEATMPWWARRSRMRTVRRAELTTPFVPISAAERGVKEKLGRSPGLAAGVIQR